MPGRAGWRRPQTFEEEMPSPGQAASQPLSPESTREKQKAVKGKRECSEEVNKGRREESK